MHALGHCQLRLSALFSERTYSRRDTLSSRGLAAGQSVRLECKLWDSGEESFGVGVLGLSEEPLGGCGFYDIAMLQNGDPVAERGYR